MASEKRQTGTNLNLSEKTLESNGAPKSPGRRRFIAGLGAATAAVSTGVLAPIVAASSASAQSASSAASASAVPAGVSNGRIIAAYELRVSEATQDALVGPAVNVNNGDTALYPDKGGTYTKGLPHDGVGRVHLNAFASSTHALKTGEFSDIQKIIVGGTRTQNGPQGGLAFDLARLDDVQFGQPQVPPAPTTASDQNATELLEHYRASLLRDVAFTDYDSNTTASQAAAELGSQSTYLGPRSGGQVTPDLLFRGAFPGETLGPYLSQFFIKPTALGAQPISQQLVTYVPNIDYLADKFTDWVTVQNGNVTGLRNQV